MNKNVAGPDAEVLISGSQSGIENAKAEIMKIISEGSSTKSRNYYHISITTRTVPRIRWFTFLDERYQSGHRNDLASSQAMPSQNSYSHDEDSWDDPPSSQQFVQPHYQQMPQIGVWTENGEGDGSAWQGFQAQSSAPTTQMPSDTSFQGETQIYVPRRLVGTIIGEKIL